MSESSFRKDFFQAFRDRIASGELDHVLTELRELSVEYSKYISNLAIQLKARLSSLRREQIEGICSSDDFRLEKNRISSAALGLIDQLERALPVQNLPVVAPKLVVDAEKVIDVAKFEKIVGINNLKQIAWLEHGLKASRSVCRVLTERGLGTGFLIAPDRMMTNHHVISTKELAQNTVIEFNYQLDFGGNASNTVRYRLDPEVLFQTSETNDLDYTVVAVKSPSSGFPGLESWGVLRLNADAAPIPGEHVAIVQHPNGQPKQIVLTANSVLQVSERFLHYSTDTMPGSSGSPVFNDLWQVIAIHHAAGDIAHGAPVYSNEGILMSAIRSSLSTNWPA